MRTEHSRLLDYVRMLEGKSDSERRNMLIEILHSEGHDCYREEYKIFGRKGVNVVLVFGEGNRDILATAHYDCAKNSPGANDNASSVSVLLDLSKRLKSYRPKNRIKIVFFDAEEPVGMRWRLGSTAYIREHGINNLIGVYNLELCGMGDTVGIWPVTKESEGSLALSNLRQTLEEKGYAYREAGKLPFFHSDHTSFRKAGFNGAFSLSVVPHDDMEAIRKFAESYHSKAGMVIMWYLGKLGLRFKIPLMFQHYHSPEDKSDYLSEEALRLMSDVIYYAITNLDQKAR